MKKLICKNSVSLILAFILILSPLAVYAENTVQKPDTSGIRNYAVYDMTGRFMIDSKNVMQKIQTASITKLVTALTALEYVKEDEVFTAGSELSMIGYNSSVCGLREGCRLTLSQLIRGLLISSGNDAAYTVAVNTARLHSKNPLMDNAEAVSYFCGLMNTYAKNAGAADSHFVNPDGWDNEDNYSTVSDLIKIAYKVAENPFLSETVSTSRYKCTSVSGHTFYWTNTNCLLDENSAYYYKYADGMKTGTTGGAKKCLMATAEKNNRKILVVAMGCTGESDRYIKVRELFESAFSSPAMGDADNDGAVTAADARIILRVSVKLEKETDFIKKYGDTNADGHITSDDARSILRFSVGLEKFFG